MVGHAQSYRALDTILIAIWHSELDNTVGVTISKLAELYRNVRKASTSSRTVLTDKERTKSFNILISWLCNTK